MSSTQTSPMTRSAAAKLRAKRKSGGHDDDSSDAATAAAAANADPIQIADAAIQAQSEPPASKRQKLPVRSKEEEKAEEEEGEDDDGDEEDSDDEAPEAISTVQAAAATRTSAQKATKAADKLAADQKRKRQERDARLKAQAETRKAREEEEAEEARKQAEAEAEEAKAKKEQQQQKDERAQNPAAKAATAAAAKPSKKAVSKLLPLEFLESDSEGEELEKTTTTAGKRPLSTTAETRPRKQRKHHPKDRQLGTTVYRVLADSGPKTLAPKLRKYSRNVRQELLARKRVGKPVGGGFLVRR